MMKSYKFVLQTYPKLIRDRVESLLRSKSYKEFDYKNDLHKIFEYYVCLQLSNDTQTFLEYSDLPPDFKEANRMSRNDTGIDCCDMEDSVIQCKLRTNSLCLKECATFFASQIISQAQPDGKMKSIVRWQNMIVARNEHCKLSSNLDEWKSLDRFQDVVFSKDDVLKYCESVMADKSLIKWKEDEKVITLRDYQEEAIDMIRSASNKNVIINIPTGTGKNIIITNSLISGKKYLVLVPRIILMEQFKDCLLSQYPIYKEQIEFVGDSSSEYSGSKLITVCCYNSIEKITTQFEDFERIFIDEAHNIRVPEIYYDDDDTSSSETESQTYLEIISNLTIHNNNILLSATIDPIDGYDVYSKDIRDMIEEGYICDYKVNIPIFNEDPTDLNICQHLIREYQNIIIYCVNQKEGRRVSRMMNRLLPKSTAYIDCNTSKSRRNKLISDFKKGKILFLVNVRVLVEGFDAPITKGVCFFHLPKSKNNLIQIIGRALRKHHEKMYAQIIIPFSKSEDESAIAHFMNILGRSDKRIRKSIEGKTVGGYIDITKEYDDTDNEVVDDTIELKYNMVFDRMGVLMNRSAVWSKRLEDVKQYIDKNHKRPTDSSKDTTIKVMGIWISNQQTNYKKSTQIMSNPVIREKWKEFIKSEQYGMYVGSNEDKWNRNLKSVKKYIDKHHKRPSKSSKDNETKTLGYWIGRQIQNYTELNYIIMSSPKILESWEEFIKSEQYEMYFESNEDKWNRNLKSVKKYIDKHHKRPPDSSKDNETKTLGYWIGHQIQNYKNSTGIMKTPKIREAWEEFIKHDSYKKYFIKCI